MFELGKSRPWTQIEAGPDLMAPIGMVAPAERACYWWMGRNMLTDEGHLIDAGSFLGAATACFAKGAAEAGQTGPRNGRTPIQSYDYFKVVDAYVGEAITRDFRPIAEGESYLDIFEAQTAASAHMITPHAGDFLEHDWDGAPVDVLFIDIAKTIDLNAHAVKLFFPALVPGHSTVLHQDYFHCWHPYIHYGMEYFADEFTLLDEHVPDQTRVWQLTSPLSAEKIGRLASGDLDAAERLALLDRLIARSSDQARPMIELVRIWQQCLDRSFDDAEAAMVSFKQAHGLPREGLPLWAVQAEAVERHIQKGLK